MARPTGRQLASVSRLQSSFAAKHASLPSLGLPFSSPEAGTCRLLPLREQQPSSSPTTWLLRTSGAEAHRAGRPDQRATATPCGTPVTPAVPRDVEDARHAIARGPEHARRFSGGRVVRAGGAAAGETPPPAVPSSLASSRHLFGWIDGSR